MDFYDRREERTGVQISEPYSPGVDLQCDFVMVYGVDSDIASRVSSWKERGYIVHLMTGVAWGKYVDFLDGTFDGREHWDEGQVTFEGKEKGHGYLTPYMSPSVAFADYLTEKLKTAVDAGVDAIHLEEPEFWAECGYSDSFKREWQIYYNEEWQDPLSSADAQFKASKLKSYLYKRTLDRLCSSLKEYAKAKYNRNIRFYVPTHSLINYSQWKIVSPESSLIDLPSVDGYIAQIWTGTSREDNVYEGVLKERTFETAFLEYGIMQELTRGTGRGMWFLHDPIEDNPRYTWEDYRRDYYKTVTASLFHYHVHQYEVCPWPNRVMYGKYPRNSENAKPIPPEYATNLLSVMHTLRNMDQSECRWEGSNIEVGVLLADSAMFQRMYPYGSEEAEDNGELTKLLRWNSFYGLSLPLLKQGLAVKPVQLDNIRRFPSYLNRYHTLILSYEFMKPEYPDIHNAIAQWVKQGGNLIYVGDGSDIFNSIQSWWNQNGADYSNPAEHLFECCGLGRSPKLGMHECEKGNVYYMPIHPKYLAFSKEEARGYRDVVEQVLKKQNIEWKKSSSLILHRGPYTITAVMDESVSKTPKILKGDYIDLYTHDLKIVSSPKLEPGSVGLYYSLSHINKKSDAEIIAISARITAYVCDSKHCALKAVGPEGVTCAARIYTKRAPKSISAKCCKENYDISYSYDETTKTTLINFENSPNGVSVNIRF